MDKYEQYDLDKAVEIANETWSTFIEKENPGKTKKNNKEVHNRCNIKW